MRDSARDGTTVEFAGDAQENGRRVVTYTYRVPQMSSGYALLVAENEAVVGFHGMFTADAGSHELLRLNIVVDDTPLGLQLLSSRVLTEYEQISIGGSSFLLPRSSELTMVDLTGRETRNRTRFSNCRQYAGQSSVSFSDMPAVETGPARRRSGAI